MGPGANAGSPSAPLARGWNEVRLDRGGAGVGAVAGAKGAGTQPRWWEPWP